MTEDIASLQRKRMAVDATTPIILVRKQNASTKIAPKDTLKDTSMEKPADSKKAIQSYWRRSPHCHQRNGRHTSSNENTWNKKKYVKGREWSENQ